MKKSVGNQTTLKTKKRGVIMDNSSKDFRVRKLGVSGLIPELICTIELKKLKRIKCPDIFGGKPEVIRNFRVVWNSNAENLIDSDKRKNENINTT